MAKTYTLLTQGTFTITDNGGTQINSITDSYSYATLTSDTIQTGIVSIASGGTETINVQTIATRALLYVRNNNASGGSNVTIASAATDIITLQPEEWFFAPIDCSSSNITIEALTANSEVNYLIVEQ